MRSTSDDPIVPNPRPPFAGTFVRRSQRVAPKGRVSTNAIQNSTTGDILVQYFKATTNAMSDPIRMAHPSNPSPELSAKKSPRAVQRVLEKSIATQ